MPATVTVTVTVKRPGVQIGIMGGNWNNLGSQKKSQTARENNLTDNRFIAKYHISGLKQCV